MPGPRDFSFSPLGGAATTPLADGEPSTRDEAARLLHRVPGWHVQHYRLFALLYPLLVICCSNESSPPSGPAATSDRSPSAAGAALPEHAAIQRAYTAPPRSSSLNWPVKTFPQGNWIVRAPGELGMSTSGLAAVAAFLGGEGFVARRGYQVYTWGSTSQVTDIASSVKSIIGFLTVKAVQTGKLSSLDSKVNVLEPRLNSINPNLDYKDRNITWKHLANMMSGYGITKKPGAYYDYSDYNVALWFDALLKAYRVSPSEVNSKLFRPHIAGPLRMQDNPDMQSCKAGNVGRACMSVRDFARWAHLMLNRGDWNGTRLISSTNAALLVNPTSTQKVLKSSTPVAFGSTCTAAAMIAGQRDFGGGRCQQDRNYGGAYHHGFWLNKKSDGSLRFSNAPANLFHTSGHRCSKRSIFVWPDLNLVIAFNNSRMDGFADCESARSQLIDKVNAAVRYDDP
jgi:CubicO group peptidase (beta-lactamase class C family)